MKTLVPISEVSTSTVDRADDMLEPVLFLLNSLGLGGSERKTIAIVNELHAMGQNVHLAYIDDRAPLLDGVKKDVPLFCLRRKGKVSFAAVSRLRTYVRENGISKVVCVNLYPLIYGVAAANLLSASQKPKVLLLENTTEQMGRKEQLSMLFYRFLMRRAERIIFGCRTQLERWVRRYGLDECVCGFIYNGIDAANFAPGVTDRESSLAEWNVEADKTDIILGAVGNLWPNKNHVELISALEGLGNTRPTTRLLIAGEGPERARLETAAESSGLQDRISLLGRIENVRDFLEVIDVFILPSISETFSNAVLEAMSMEKPVILSNTGGMPEIVRDGLNGYLYNQGDVAHLQNIIQRLVADRATRRAVGKDARETVLKKFTFQRMIGEYLQLLR